MKTGWLYRTGENERWNVIHNIHKHDYTVLTSGSFVEVKVGRKWIPTTIEHNGKDYYATTRGLALSNQMQARIR